MVNSFPILKKKLSEQVRDRIEVWIRDEVYPVGSFLPSERELMAKLGVGRPSIREALFSLERMGLVKIGNGERPVVTRPTPQGMIEQLAGSARLLLQQPNGIDHFEQLRLFLEDSIVRYAAEFATEQQVLRLAEALKNNEDAIPHMQHFVETDIVFHRFLMEIPGNPIFIAVHQAIVDWLIKQRVHVVNAEEENRETYLDHRRIYEAIAAKNPEQAARAMRAHLIGARQKYLSKSIHNSLSHNDH